MIYCLIPEYIEGTGDCCILYGTEGEEIQRKKINSSLKDLFNDKCLDMRTVKHKSSKLLGQRNLIPLYLGRDEILIPVKVRKPRVHRDTGYGYVNFYAINNINEETILLKNNKEIFFCEGKRRIIKRIKMARIIEEAFKSSLCREMALDYLSIPATKEDISLILRQIEEIKRTMERMMLL
ncbi:hypothetical protein [Fonticella tunisiensis]|uniref:ComK protein n=1 Tax=Fonticella tunisiensis TaxID=1096341 RepID=A0A4R7KS30_9CLOT|nr:hypothetical protein [Fonticella tunisiensis]TDT62415.1 hypothetical protein EDD71_104146 [Fonticella tunisiensis]